MKMMTIVCVGLVLAGGSAFGRVAPVDAEHRSETRRFQGIPSIAISQKTGRMWCTWYAGPSPREDFNNYCVLATSTDGGRTWKEVLTSDPDGRGGIRAFDPEVWIAPDGKLRWTWSESSVWGWNARKPDDNRLMGVTLNAEAEPEMPAPEPARLVNGVMMCKPIVCASGVWLYPLAEWYQEQSVIAYETRDGATFARKGAVAVPKEIRNCDEPMFIEKKSGALTAFIRTGRGLMLSESCDGGKTWTAPAKAQGVDGPATRLFVRKLKSGNWLLVKNGRSANGNHGRYDLTAFLSKDEGKTWTGGLLLDARGESTYPDGDQAPDGRIHVVYDRDRVGERDILMASFTEEDVLQGKITDRYTRLRRIVTCWPSKAARRAVVEKAAEAALAPPNVYAFPEVPERYGPAYEKFVMHNGAAVTKKGRIWVSWIGGEDSDEAYTLAAWSDDGGKTWRNPALVVDGHGPIRGARVQVSNIIANFWIDPEGMLHLFFSQSVWHNDGRMGVWEMTCVDPDAAFPAWTEPRRISDGAALNKPVVMKNGDWVLPVEIARPYGPWEDWFRDGVGTSTIATTLTSRDGGRTWTRGGDMTVPIGSWPENHVLELANGKWRMYARSYVGLWTAESADRGRTWSEAVKPKGMDMITSRCQVRKLRSGTWIFVRHEGPVDSFYPSTDDSHRDKIVLWASKDEGKTWKGGLVVEESKMVSYPDLEEGPDGRLYISHDFERQTGAEIRLHIVREADVWAGKIVSPDAQLGIRVTKAMNSAHNRKNAK